MGNHRLIPLLFGICALNAVAQVRPDAGQILQETRPDLRAPETTLPPIEAPALPKKPLPAVGADVRVQVTGFNFIGNKVIPDEALQAIVAGYVGRALNFGELIEAVEAVEAHYKDAGYFLAQGYLPPQKIKDGTIDILISEGLLASVRLEGESRVAPETVYAYLDRLPKGEVLALPVLERQILLINELAGSQASLDLQAGEKEGTTDVVLMQKADDAVTGRVELNNHGSPSTGEHRLGLTLNALSPFQRGERISLNVLTSEQQLLDSYALRGEFPLGADGWRLTASASKAAYTLGEPFKALGASGTADSLRVGVAYPFIRSRQANLRLQVEADQSKLADHFKTAGTHLEKTSRGVMATLGGDLQDQWQGGGMTRADLSLKLGRLDLGTSAKTADTLKTDGHFEKLGLTLSRQQTLSPELSLSLQLTGQLASKNLDSSEKLSLGGPATLPGYANGEGSGDAGTLVKAALRWQATPELALSAFADHGRLRLSKNPLAGANNHKRLADAGLGVDWQPVKEFTASLIAAWATGDTPNPVDNDAPRLWMSLGYQW